MDSLIQSKNWRSVASKRKIAAIRVIKGGYFRSAIRQIKLAGPNISTSYIKTNGRTVKRRRIIHTGPGVRRVNLPPSEIDVDVKRYPPEQIPPHNVPEEFQPEPVQHDEPKFIVPYIAYAILKYRHVFEFTFVDEDYDRWNWSSGYHRFYQREDEVVSFILQQHPNLQDHAYDLNCRNDGSWYYYTVTWYEYGYAAELREKTFVKSGVIHLQKNDESKGEPYVSKERWIYSSLALADLLNRYQGYNLESRPLQIKDTHYEVSTGGDHYEYHYHFTYYFNGFTGSRVKYLPSSEIPESDYRKKVNSFGGTSSSHTSTEYTLPDPTGYDWHNYGSTGGEGKGSSPAIREPIRFVNDAGTNDKIAVSDSVLGGGNFISYGIFNRITNQRTLYGDYDKTSEIFKAMENSYNEQYDFNPPVAFDNQFIKYRVFGDGTMEYYVPGRKEWLPMDQMRYFY